MTANEHAVPGTVLDEITGDTAFDKAGLKTATVDANHIHKERYSFQRSVVFICNFLKEAQEASSVLPLFLWTEECSSCERILSIGC